ncbi:MAG: hypothetical protein U0166_06715 [Acidobacteriota bacterium]
MKIADVATWLLIVTGAYLAVNACWMVSAALFPGAVESCLKRYRRPILATFIGLGILVPFVVIGVGLSSAIKNPGASGIVKMAMLLPILPALLGSAGLATRVGAGIPASIDDREPWRRTQRGGIVLSLTFLLPFVGWFMILPWTLVSGFGAAVGALLSRSAPRT